MSNEFKEFCDDFSSLLSNENTIRGNDILRILKEYASTVSVFDMMAFSAQVIEENRYVQESYREESQKSYIESFLLRTRDILKDSNDYGNAIDKESFSEAVDILKTHYEMKPEDSNTKISLIFDMASIYATFILEESIHPIGTPFPGSLKVKGENGKFYCPVKDANLETPNAVCKMCLAEHLDF